MLLAVGGFVLGGCATDKPGDAAPEQYVTEPRRQ